MIAKQTGMGAVGACGMPSSLWLKAKFITAQRSLVLMNNTYPLWLKVQIHTSPAVSEMQCSATLGFLILKKKFSEGEPYAVEPLIR